mgnify:CR=1 FL=1
MKLMSGFFGLIQTVAFICNSILVLYVGWLQIRGDFIQLLNTFLYLEVLFTLLQTPLFWILIIVTGVSMLEGAGVEKINDDYFSN